MPLTSLTGIKGIGINLPCSPSWMIRVTMTRNRKNLPSRCLRSSPPIHFQNWKGRRGFSRRELKGRVAPHHLPQAICSRRSLKTRMLHNKGGPSVMVKEMVASLKWGIYLTRGLIHVSLAWLLNQSVVRRKQGVTVVLPELGCRPSTNQRTLSLLRAC